MFYHIEEVTGLEEHIRDSEFDPHYDRREAQMGARWVREDGRPCPCHGSGWLITSMFDTVRCGACPEGQHPEDDRSPEEYRRDMQYQKEYNEGVAFMVENGFKEREPPFAAKVDDDIPF